MFNSNEKSVVFTRKNKEYSVIESSELATYEVNDVYVAPIREKHYIKVNGKDKYVVNATLYRENVAVASAEFDSGTICNGLNIFKIFGDVNCRGMDVKAVQMKYNQLLDKTEVISVYEAGGWYRNDFVLGHLKIKADGVDEKVLRNDCGCEIPCEGTTAKKFNLKNEEMSKTFVKDIFDHIFNVDGYGYICLVYLIFAMLEEKMPKGSDGFCLLLAIIGDTGLMKTSSMKAIYNPLDYSILNASFTNSSSAIKSAAALAKGNVLIVDDMSAVTSKNKDVLEELLREIGDKGSCSKKMRGNKLSSAYVPNMVLTGETLTKVQRSSLARMLVLEFDEGTLNVETLTRLQKNRDLFLSFQYYFIRFVMKNANLIAEMTDSFSLHREQLHGIKWHQKRCPTVIAWFMAGAETINRFLGETYISIDDFKGCIIKIMEQNWAKYSVTNPVRLYLETLYDMVENDGLLIGDEFLGKVSIKCRENVWIMPNMAIYNAVANRLLTDGYSEVDIISNKKLLSELKRMGILVLVNNRNTVVIKGYKNEKVRGIKILKSKLLSYLHIEEEYSND